MADQTISPGTFCETPTMGEFFALQEMEDRTGNWYCARHRVAVHEWEWIIHEQELAPHPSLATCPDCGGVTDDQCWTCHGRGTIPKEGA